MACTQCAARQAAACNMQIDYSTVQGTRILPFVVALDTANSILAPEPGERQRFCYQITAVGEESSRYADLSHLVLGICDQIGLEDLNAVAVAIDGVFQPIRLGDNVEIRSADEPDPPTGCAGIKFDFPLDKVTGVMQLCFELNEVYAVGPIPVCLYGGAVTAGNLTICGPVCDRCNQCTAIGYQAVNVCVPVTVTPFARPGVVRTCCCGAPVVTPGESVCPGEMLGSCTFTITQQVCVAVPVTFGAEVALGDHSVECLGASPENPDETEDS